MVQQVQQYHITEITPATVNWRCKVLVLDKSNIHTNEAGHRTQKVLLLDDKGNKIEGLMWNNNIGLPEHSLHPFSTYVVGGAKVRTIKTEYLHISGGMKLQWILSRSTFIRPVTDMREVITYPAVQAVPFSDIQSYAGSGDPIDIIAAVVAIKPPKRRVVRSRLIQLQECTVITPELKPMMLTLWGDFVSNQGAEIYARRESMPIIVGRGLMATTYAGVSLSTVPLCYVAVEPAIPQVNNMRQWVDIHKHIIKSSAVAPIINYIESILKKRGNLAITLITDIPPDGKNVCVEVSMFILHTMQKVCYCTCLKCIQVMEAQPNEEFYCHICKSDEIAVPRCKVVTEMHDPSGKITAIAFDKAAERLLRCDATELHTKDEEAIQDMIKDLKKWVEGRKFIVEIRASKKKYTYKNTRFTIQDWIEKEACEVTTSTSEGVSNSMKSSSDIQKEQVNPNVAAEVKVVGLTMIREKIISNETNSAPM